MKPLDELISSESAIRVIHEWIDGASTVVELLPPAERRNEVLLALQTSTLSVLGSVGYETGGILIDHGWLRIIGSGHPKLPRSLDKWNESKADGFYLVADDVVGGFFAMNGGSLGEDIGKLYYFAPDRLQWEPMGLGYSQFVWWCMSDRVAEYYQNVRWTSWAEGLSSLPVDSCYHWHPPLWTKEGKDVRSRIGHAPVQETWKLGLDFKSQLENA